MLAAALLLALAAPPAASSSSPAAPAAPPTLAELGEIAYRDVVEGQSLRLARGFWRGEGWAEPGKPDPVLRLLAEPFATGDLDGDGQPAEAAAILAANGASPESYRLLALVARRGGAVVNLATFRLGDGVRIASLAFADRALTAVVEEPVERTDFFRPRTRHFIATGDSAREVLPLSALGTTWWRLTEIDDRPQLGPLQPWLGHERGALVGIAICDRFRLPVTQRGGRLTPGELERSAGQHCTDGMKRRDARFFDLLDGAERFEPGKGAVTLVVRDTKGEHRLLLLEAGPELDRSKQIRRPPAAKLPPRPAPTPPAPRR